MGLGDLSQKLVTKWFFQKTFPLSSLFLPVQCMKILGPLQLILLALIPVYDVSQTLSNPREKKNVSLNNKRYDNCSSGNSFH